MNVPIIDIELVVREVLAELGALKANGEGACRLPAVSNGQSAVGSTSASLHLQSPIPNPSAAPASPGDLAISSRVVTMTDILGRLNGARRVLVSREAIVTPAVRDELIRRGVALEYVESTNGKPAPVRLAVITMGTNFDPAALAAGMGREGLKVEHTALDCILAATEQLAAETAKPDTLGVLLTRHTAAGLCLANRFRGVRAILGVDAAGVATAAGAVGANLLVTNPLAGTFFQLKQMVSEFCRGGVRPCPEVFRARLA
jgi:hypothetical protein